MYYFVDMYEDKLTFIDNINSETCLKILENSDSINQVLDFYFLGKCVGDAWDELIEWSNNSNSNGKYILRNLHTAERLVRGFLFKFRTCLDHMETEIKRAYGEDSDLWNIFKEGTSNAYDNRIEYAFASHLRNCSQHCKNVVHGFNCSTGIGISSNTSRLLSEYKKWKQIDKDYMAACGSEVDLLKTFSETFSAFNTALKPVMQYLLNNNNTGTKLLYLREWGDSLHRQFKHDVHCYHIVNIVFSDGSSATQNDMASGDVIVNAYPLDWELIYELSDLVTPLKQK